MKAEHTRNVSALIRSDIDALDEFQWGKREQLDDPDIPDDIEDNENTHVILGAKQVPCTFKSLQDRGLQDPAFRNFLSHLTKFLRRSMPNVIFEETSKVVYYQQTGSDSHINLNRYKNIGTSRSTTNRPSIGEQQLITCDAADCFTISNALTSRW